MRSVDDRRTLTSSVAAVAPRLVFPHVVARRTMLDGAWWPRSRDPVVEVSDLVVALDACQLPISRIMLNPSGWDSHPRRIGVAGRTVRLGWFATLDAEHLIATTSEDKRVDLFVVSPDASSASADVALTMAASGPDALTATAIRATMVAQTSGSPTKLSPAEANWESEGGRVNGYRPQDTDHFGR
jgi:hypothetical protein